MSGNRDIRDSVQNMRPLAALRVPIRKDILEVLGDDPTRVDPHGHPLDPMRLRRNRHRPKRKLVRQEVVARSTKDTKHLRDRVRVSERHRRDVVRRAVVRHVELGDGAQGVREPGPVAVRHRGLVQAERLGVLRRVQGLRRRGFTQRTPCGDGILICHRGDLVVDAAEWEQAVVRVACAFTVSVWVNDQTAATLLLTVGKRDQVRVLERDPDDVLERVRLPHQDLRCQVMCQVDELGIVHRDATHDLCQ